MHTERLIERQDIADAIARGPEDAAAERPMRPASSGRRLRGMSAHDHAHCHELVRNGNRVDQRVELARYIIAAGERVVRGQRISGVVRVTDSPAGGRGRAYLVERELEQDGHAALQALVADYVEQAQCHGEIPCTF
jgi:hypothetical protein